MEEKKTRTLLVDDHAVVRAGLRSLLSGVPDIVVVGEARNGREALTMVAGTRPDVIVMDLTMPDLDGMQATKLLVERDPQCRVLVLTMHSEEEYLVAVLEAGALGFLLKSAAGAELAGAIRTVAKGEMYVQPSAIQLLAGELRSAGKHSPERALYDALNEREKDVLVLTAKGFSAPEIGSKLFISPKTVDTYKQRLKEKLGLAHRSDYVRIALRLQLFQE